jgi:propionyl-CoA synthetase
VLDDSRPPFYRWFPGGLLNTCYNALDRHVENGRADQPALIYDSPVTGPSRRSPIENCSIEWRALPECSPRKELKKAIGSLFTCRWCRRRSSRCWHARASARFIRWSSAAFASHELAKRITDAAPKVIISASCGIEAGRVIPYKPLLDKAIELAAVKPERCIIVQRPQENASMIGGRDLDWSDEMADAKPAGCVPVEATDPLYILYTSGTTGMPKGIVRDNGGHLVALTWSMQHIYGVAPGEVYWAASDVGWVVGHSYIVYAPLFNGNTTILYEGKPVGTPDAGAFWRVVSQHGVKVLFTAPTAFRAIKREDPNGEFIRKYDLSGFRTLFLAGERCDPDTLLWAQKQLDVPVIDHWWQTETGWPIGANCIGLGMLPVKPGSCTKPVPGYNVQVLDDNSRELPPEQIGSIVIKLPLPPGLSADTME